MAKSVSLRQMKVLVIGKEKVGGNGEETWQSRSVLFVEPSIPNDAKIDQIPDSAKAWVTFYPEQYHLVENLRKGVIVSIANTGKTNKRGEPVYALVVDESAPGPTTNGNGNGSHSTNGNGSKHVAPPVIDQEYIDRFRRWEARFLREAYNTVVAEFSRDGKCYADTETVQAFASGIHIQFWKQHPNFKIPDDLDQEF